MKKILLSMLCAAAVLPISAKVVTFTPEVSNYKATEEGEEVVTVAMTWTGRTIYNDDINFYVGNGTKEVSRGGFIIANKGVKNKDYASADQVYFQINPVSGIKVTKVTMAAYNSSKCVGFDNMSETAEGEYRIFTWTGECESTATENSYQRFPLTIDDGKVVDGVYASDYSAEGARVKYVRVEYEGTSQRSAMPIANITYNYVTDKAIEFSCPEPGAKIYYTITGGSFKNGFDATPADDTGFVEYDGTPIIISEPTDVQAYAYVEGKKKSGLLYRWVFPGPEEANMAVFDFSKPETLGRVDATKTLISNEPLKNNGITFTMYSAATKDANAIRLMNTIAYGEEYDIRPGDDNGKNFNKFIFETDNEENQICAIYFIGHNHINSFGAARAYAKSSAIKDENGETIGTDNKEYEFPDIVKYGDEDIDSEYYYKKILKAPACTASAVKYISLWQQNPDYDGDASANRIIFDHFSGGGNTTCISKIHVFYYGDAPEAGSSVGNLYVEDNKNAPIEYYNLQGVRVSGDQPGLYIVRQGSKTKKVIVK